MRKFETIPEWHRLYSSAGWTGMAVLGGPSGHHAPHKDAKEGAIPGVILALGKNVSGGSTIYYHGSEKVVVEHCHGRMQLARFGQTTHEGTQWVGNRRIISWWVGNAAAEYFCGGWRGLEGLKHV